MNIASAKVDLAKRILNTEHKDIITYIKAIFDSQPDNWFGELPNAVQASVERALKQSQNGEGRAHSAVMKTYKK